MSDSARFIVRCENCGTERFNDDGYECWLCGSTAVSYASDDAKRWNAALGEADDE